MREIRKCLECGKDFSTYITLSSKKNAGKYCSYPCKWKYQSLQVKRKCQICSEEFIAKRNRTRARFCSRHCKEEWHKTVFHTSESKLKMSLAQKGKVKPLEYRLRMKKFWQKNAPRGENHPMWKGGITKLVLRVRHCYKYDEWRKSVFKRDNYTCCWCGDMGYINADHIKPFSIIFKENNIKDLESALECKELWDIENGRALCVPCHKLTDTFKGKMRKYETT